MIDSKVIKQICSVIITTIDASLSTKHPTCTFRGFSRIL